MGRLRVRRGGLILVGLAGALGALGCSTQTWAQATLPTTVVVSVTGQESSGAFPALCLALAAALLAATLMARLGLLILGGLGVAIAASGGALAVSSIADPGSGLTAAVGEATGVAGEKSVDSLLEGAQATAWPWLALLCLALAAMSCALLAVRSRRLGRARAARRMSRKPAADAGMLGGEPDAAVLWDRLSDGEDPTAQSSPRASGGGLD